MKKRILAMLLTAAVCLGIIFSFVPTALAFTDIPDEDTAQAAEVLQLLGVVDGTGGGAFSPSAPLTRASFCKMALIAAGRGSEAQAQGGRVVFPDVTAAHWALGYVNAAAFAPSESSPLIRGKGDGKFHPDESVTFGEAVTILMRMLGYADGDVGTGAAWYSGYLSAAAGLELTDGFDCTGTRTITRGEAARLFERLFFTDLKDSSTPYLSKLDGSVTDSAVILSADATADDGSTGAVQTSLGTYKTGLTSFPSALEGVRGALALDKNGRLLAVRPDETDTYRYVNVASCDADYVLAPGGEKLSVDPDTAVWSSDGASTYESEWTGLRAGSRLVLCYDGSGMLSYLFIGGASGGETAAVAKGTSFSVNPFAYLADGASGYAMYKNGSAATLADIRQYDVATYDKASNSIRVSDLKLTGAYESVYPNSTAPSSLTLMGTEFTVLSSAVSDLKNFAPGDNITLLLTANLQVAGVVSASTVRSAAAGVANLSGTSASVTLLDGRITVQGKTSMNADQAAAIDGELVTVTSSRTGYLNLTKISAGGSSASLNVAGRTLGGRALAGNVQLYEKVGAGPLSRISLDDVTAVTVPATRILYASYDYAGRVCTLVFSNATGDGYTYGYLVYTPEIEGSDMDDSGSPATIAVRYADESGSVTTTTPIACGTLPVSGKPGGIALTTSGKLAGYVVLESLKNLSRSAFDQKAGTVTAGGVVYPVWEAVQCYNSTTGAWYTPGSDGLAKALAFSDNLTVYYDRAPGDGGKIRLVVAN
jgi:hypothetical protein